MLKDRPHLCQYMPKRRDARRLVADPGNEPNFYKISEENPLSPQAGATAPCTEDPCAKRARTDSFIMSQASPTMTQVAQAMAAAPLANTAYPQTTNNILFGLVNQTAVAPAPPPNQITALLSLLEAQNKKREEEKKQQEAVATVMRMLQGQQHQQTTQQPMMQQQPMQAPVVPQQQQPTQHVNAANLSVLMGLLNQMNWFSR